VPQWVEQVERKLLFIQLAVTAINIARFPLDILDAATSKLKFRAEIQTALFS